MATTTDIKTRIRRANAMMTLADDIQTAVLAAPELTRFQTVADLLKIRDDLLDQAKREVAAADKAMQSDEADTRAALSTPRPDTALVAL
jgi:hypothetical protein